MPKSNQNERTDHTVFKKLLKPTRIPEYQTRYPNRVFVPGPLPINNICKDAVRKRWLPSRTVRRTD